MAAQHPVALSLSLRIEGHKLGRRVIAGGSATSDRGHLRSRGLGELLGL
jgi:hypothetical protein